MSNNSEKVVVRMAPSPTGYLHIGGVRTALFNFLFARHNDGKYILRSEDTDKERSKSEYEDDIVAGFKWLGLEWDEFYRQSDRTEIYKKYLKQLIDDDFAYISKEEPKEGQRSEVIRFKNPNKKIQFDDMVRGSVEFDTTDLGDFVIAKSLEEPLYHLAVVVDDYETGITHVIRAEEHISNTPRQILIQEAIGAKRPIYAHLPIIVNEERQKLSKRKHGEMVWLTTYRNKGYLPEAILNYMALLGWNPGTDQEIFTMEELIKEFDFSKVQKSSAFFDIKKLDWVNKEHIKRLPEEVQKEMREREVSELPFIKNRPDLDVSKISWKPTRPDGRSGGEVSDSDTKKYLEEVKKLIPDADAIMKYAESVGKGNVLWPLRYALSGLEKSPDPFILMDVLGAEEAKNRVQSAIDILS